MALRQLFPLFRCPFIRTCLSLYYPRTLFGTLYFDDLTSFGPRKKSVDVFLAGLPKLREDIGDVFLGIDLVQPRRPYDRHVAPFSEWLKRKNRLFANTRKGGDVSCAMYSSAETAIHNALISRFCP